MVDTESIRIQEADEVGIQGASPTSKAGTDHESQQLVTPGLYACGFNQGLVLADGQQYTSDPGVQDQRAQRGGQHGSPQDEVVVASATA